MESVNRRVILVALIMALFTSFLVYIYIKKATVKPEAQEYTKVYVAAKTLPPKHKIVEDDLKQIQVTKEYLNSKAVLNKADIVGKSLKDSIIEGEQILRDRLVDENKSQLAFSIPGDKRAVSINVNDQIDVSGLIRPGDYVDVIASFDKEDVEDRSSKTTYPRITRTIVQNVLVLAMGQDQIINDDKLKEIPKTVTLAVTPQDAEKLVFSSEYGVLRLVLRQVGDDKTIDTQGTVRSDIVTDKGAKSVPK